MVTPPLNASYLRFRKQLRSITQADEGLFRAWYVAEHRILQADFLRSNEIDLDRFARLQFERLIGFCWDMSLPNPSWESES